METNQQSTDLEGKISKTNTVASIALVISLIALGLSGWMLYTSKYIEDNKPQNMEKKVDKFFESQDKEFDKMFDEKEKSQ
jgi:hypothetical protein